MSTMLSIWKSVKRTAIVVHSLIYSLVFTLITRVKIFKFNKEVKNIKVHSLNSESLHETERFENRSKKNDQVCA